VGRDLSVLRVEDHDGVRVLTLDRPDALNAFNTPLYDACAQAFHDATARADIACVVLTGTGRAFSAGQDLGEMAQIDTAGAGSRANDAGPGFPRFIDTVAAFEKRREAS
jgi:enoyl-CoA hydratase/carnithine racemase